MPLNLPEHLIHEAAVYRFDRETPRQLVVTREISSVVFAPPWQGGGVKSLYYACEALRDVGRSSIIPFHGSALATWFDHSCVLYDGSYRPDIVIYPEVHQPRFGSGLHICFVLGKYADVSPHAHLAVCRSTAIQNWVAVQRPNVPSVVLRPSIKRAVFEYRGEQKDERICYMTRPHKHPETAALLKQRYGEQLLEIVDKTEAEVADILKRSRVFVARGNDKEGSPRPPKEALVAGCNVIGLKTDLNHAYHTDFGIRCDTVEEMIAAAGPALQMPIPTEQQRAEIRDLREEKADWVSLIRATTPDAARW